VSLENTGIRTGRIFILQAFKAKMAKQHPIERIATHLRDYKCCNWCRRINWHKNSRCIGCGHQSFSPLDEEYGKNLLLDWEKEPDLLLEV